jgi:predicted DCC family thiol-disulfide oxidoreductase YuxK
VNSDVKAASEAPIVFFDGVCGLCNRYVDWLLRHDSKQRLRFAPLQGETAMRLVPESLRQQMGTLVLWQNGRRHLRTAAVCRILMILGGWPRCLGALLWLVPWPLRDLGYRLVARNRYRIFGRHETCRMPGPHERAAFLS